MRGLAPGALGLGWRPELALAIERWEGLGFVEVIPETLSPDHLTALDRLKRRGVAVLPHGVSLGLGGAERPSRKRLDALARLAERFEAPFVSEHVAFVRAGGREAGHLVPVPRTHDALEVLAENVAEAQARLPVPLALENVAALFDWPEADLTEADFLRTLLDRTGALLLADLANLHARRCNLGEDALAAIARLPLERLAYVHVGGGTWKDGRYHDTHAHPLDPAVLPLVAALAARAPGAAFMLERDAHYPPVQELRGELAAIAAAAGHALVP